jgi:hypothetical protein
MCITIQLTKIRPFAHSRLLHSLPLWERVGVKVPLWGLFQLQSAAGGVCIGPCSTTVVHSCVLQ